MEVRLKERLDRVLVEKGLAGSRQRAQALIMAGRVLVEDKRMEKAGVKVDPDANIRIKGDDIPYVSRGGIKLEKALREFRVEVGEKTVIDVGASTGGFTDCLLKQGAAKVYAVDVGYGQLAWKLREDPRVVCLDKTNIRYLSPRKIAGPVDLAVIDTSFISLEKVLPKVSELLRENGEIIALIKPQFEVGKGQVRKGGIVREAFKQQKVIRQITGFAEKIGLIAAGVIESPIMGQKGNREFFIYLKKGKVLL
ncbi:MAG: TlyA family RNA methyltransferase [Deltaproteobacteria bacterium]|nr:MAG: TlyA family RNA methyltransferase [Deltaproteobacteria bacterium]